MIVPYLHQSGHTCYECFGIRTFLPPNSDNEIGICFFFTSAVACVAYISHGEHTEDERLHAGREAVKIQRQHTGQTDLQQRDIIGQETQYRIGTITARCARVSVVITRPPAMLPK